MDATKCSITIKLGSISPLTGLCLGVGSNLIDVSEAPKEASAVYFASSKFIPNFIPAISNILVSDAITVLDKVSAKLKCIRDLLIWASLFFRLELVASFSTFL